MADFIDFLVVVLPTVIALLSVYVSIKLTKGEPHKTWWFVIIALGICTSVLTLVSQSSARKAHSEEQKDLQGRLDSSLQAQQYTRGQLDSIALMVGKFTQIDKSPAATKLATIVKQTVAKKNPGGTPHLIKVINMAAGNFYAAHQLSCVPDAVVVQMTSLGFMSLQEPKGWDDKNVYLTASDANLTADVLIWCGQSH
jgi:hypothetical protein